MTSTAAATARNDYVREIMEMFSYARPAGSDTEQEYVDRFLTPLGFERDFYRNLVLEVPTPDGARSNILFSSHVDTVAFTEGRQTLHYDGTTLALSHKAKREGFKCLGADDTAGNWLMVQMIRAGVPGVYVIHHAEESGCVGSSDLAEGSPEFFEGIEIALAFDRQGTTEIITHQMMDRTASDSFAWSLSRALDMRLVPSDDGVYTDTWKYAGLVNECSNLAVGYRGQHGQNETQDVGFLMDLRDALVACDWTSLSVARKPTAAFRPDWGGTFRYDNHLDHGAREQYSALDWSDDRERARYYDLLDGVRDHPEVAAELLASLGIDLADFEEAAFTSTGRIVNLMKLG